MNTKLKFFVVAILIIVLTLIIAHFVPRAYTEDTHTPPTRGLNKLF